MRAQTLCQQTDRSVKVRRLWSGLAAVSLPPGEGGHSLGASGEPLSSLQGGHIDQRTALEGS